MCGIPSFFGKRKYEEDGIRRSRCRFLRKILGTKIFGKKITGTPKLKNLKLKLTL
jgi:hypothetical protein